MLNVLPQFKRLIIFVQILSLSLYSQMAPAMPENQDPQQLVLTTTPIETQAGSTHIEVQAFEINNEQDLVLARQELLTNTRNNFKTNGLFILDIRTTGHASTALDSSAQKVLGEIEDSISAQHEIKTKPLVINPADKKGGLFRRHYNLSLSLVRLVANTATVSTGLIIGSGVPVEHSLLVGALVGAMSGALQFKSEAYLKWISNSLLLVKTAKKMELLSEKDTGYISTGEKTLNEIEMYGKWGLLEVGFLLVCQTAMSLLNIPITENLFLTAAKSTLSQGIFEVGVAKVTQQLEKTKWRKNAAVFRDVSLFSGSSISVLAAIGAMAGIPFANLAFVTISATGVIFHKWRYTGRTAFRCRTLFE